MVLLHGDKQNRPMAPYGLFSPAANVNYSEDPARWEGGYDYEQMINRYTARILPISGSAADDTITADGSAWGTGNPFVVELSIEASTMGMSPDKLREGLLTAVSPIVQKAAEMEFWSAAGRGTNAEEGTYLSSIEDDGDVPTLSPEQALAHLEGEYARQSKGEVGVIHLPRDVASSLKLKAYEGVLATNLLTPVIAGMGYSGEGPTGSLDGSVRWAYATGPVEVLLSAGTVYPEGNSQAVDVSVNATRFTVLQPVAVHWIGNTHVGVKVDLTEI